MEIPLGHIHLLLRVASILTLSVQNACWETLFIIEEIIFKILWCFQKIISVTSDM